MTSIKAATPTDARGSLLDDVETTGLQMRCTDRSEHMIHDGSDYSGFIKADLKIKWTGWQDCPDSVPVVCGFQAKIEPEHPDDTYGITELRTKCCPLPKI